MGSQRPASETGKTVIIRVDSDSGHSGWGEVSTGLANIYSDNLIWPDTEASNLDRAMVPADPGADLAPDQAIEALAPAIFDARKVGPESLMERLDSYLPGHLSAKSAIDTALWDLLGKAAGLPLYILLGGRHHRRLPLCHKSCCRPPGAMARVVRQAAATGQSPFRIKAPVGQMATPQTTTSQAPVRRERMQEAIAGWDGAPLGAGPVPSGPAATDRAGPHRPASSQPTADRGVMLEEPCGPRSDCAAACTATADPIERAAAPLQRSAPSGGRMDLVALRISGVGGLSTARRARDHCITLGATVCIEEAWGSDIAMAAAVHLGATTPRRGLSSLHDLSGRTTIGLDPRAPRPMDGQIAIPKAPGLGVSPDPDRLGPAHRILD